MSDYQFSSHGCCTNPEKIEVSGNLTIRLGSSDGKWGYGYDITFCMSGACSAVSVHRLLYETREQALNAAIKFAGDYIERSSRGWSFKKADKKVLKDFDAYKSGMCQKSLF